MKKKHIIPFSWMPGSWGLSGRHYDEAKAAYYNDGEDLDRVLNDIHNNENKLDHKIRDLAIDLKYQKIDGYTHDVAVLTAKNELTPRAIVVLDFHHKKITDYEHDSKLAILDNPEEVNQKLAILEVEKAYNKITQTQYDKQTADILEKPWIGIINDGFDPSQGLNGVFFEFDWNEHWITYLRVNGYGGNSEEELVEKWFQDVCQVVASERSEEDNVIPMADRFANRFDRGDGKADYT